MINFTRMEIYSDERGRVIWLTVSVSEIRLDLQDLNPDLEYERSASVIDVEAVCKALNIQYDHLESALLLMLEYQMTAFDLFTEFLDDHQIYFNYYSGMR